MLGERIAEARKKAGFSDQKSFAKSLNIGARTLADYENNNSEPKASIINNIAEICNTSREYLLTGQDVATSSSSSNNSYAIPALSIKASAGDWNHLEAIDKFDTWTTINIDKMLFKGRPSDKLRSIQVDGYSMTPMLMPDSWVIFELERGYEGDGLYIINWRNVLMVKQIQINMQSGHLRIISINPDYESYDVNPDDQSIFKIIGKVIRIII